MTAVVAVIFQMMGPFAFAADTAQGTMQISGNVPVVFSLTTRGIPGDLDLTPGVIVNDRLLGIFHLKYNVDMASLNIKSSTALGQPMNGATNYAFGTAMTYKVPAACTSVDATYNAAFSLTNVNLDIKSATASGLTTGLEEDCSLTASWGGDTSALPLAGKYSMTITFTMVSI